MTVAVRCASNYSEELLLSISFRPLFRRLPILLFPFLLLYGPHAPAQRLSNVARPQHYWLELTPDLNAATFTGNERIDVTLVQPVRDITLNALEIQFQSVTTTINGRTLTAEVTLDPAKQQATFRFPQQLPTGPHQLIIRYTGVLNSKLRGFYLSKTSRRNYAVTQFESTDARSAFPSFDEPAMKATFNVSLVVAKGDTAISNTNIISDTPGPGVGRHTIQFAQTPRMSTYLLAFLVGDFECISGASDGIPIRVCATPGHVQDGAFALSAAEFFLHYYDTYFGIKYPMPKLDMIALPDFEAGAMENFGAITYRETALLVNPNTAPLSAQKIVAVDVAHEMAHQWFGDMVTMEWWDNIWLNEGFATWMEYKPVAAWKPEWQMPQEVASNLNRTLDLDARKVTRTIRATANTPDEINEMFDGISYGKAGAVLSMVENYIGEQTFREGVHNYLAAHIYGNATAEDFWNTQTKVSHRPIDKIMQSLVTQPGEALLTFGAPQGEKVSVTQERFFLNPQTPASPETVWTLPVCVGTSSAAANCQIVDRKNASLRVPEAQGFYGNASGKGYYRSQYDAASYQKLLSQVETALGPEDRIVLLGSEWALTRADKASIGDFLNLAASVKDDRSAYVAQTVAYSLSSIDQRLVSTSHEHQLLAAWVRDTFGPVLHRLGPPAKAESAERRELRAVLFSVVGGIGDDSAVIGEARRTTSEYLEHPDSVDATLAATALRVAAQNGNSALFDQLQRMSASTDNPQLSRQTLYALARFRNPELVRRTLEYAVSGKVRNQDSAELIADELEDRNTQEVAWDFVKSNWPAVLAQTTMFTGASLVSATGSFCTVDRASEVAAYFSQHRVPASESALQHAQNNINDCIGLRSAQGPSLIQWLSAASSGHDAGQVSTIAQPN
ncbi:MAG TPA: M1 family metallopeptidase [Acidobacteriaceae bacterium]